MIFYVRAGSVTAECATPAEVWAICIEWIGRGLSPSVQAALLS